MANVNAAHWSEIRVLPLGSLKVDTRYQRFYEETWSRKIADEFKPVLFDTLQVSFRDGSYWVFDGQHRMNAAKMKFQDDNYPVTCKVYHGLTQEEEAKLFYEFNISKKKMSAADMLKSQAFYGEEDVQEFLTHTQNAGFIIDPAKRVNCRYGIQAVMKAKTIFERLGPETYDRMLSLLKSTWTGEKWSTSQNMLGGMGVFLKTYGDQINDEKFISQLKDVTEGMMAKESGRYTEESKGVAYASALVGFYNKGLRTGKLKLATLLVN